MTVQIEERKGEHAKALVLQCMIKMIQLYPQQFKHGVTKTEMKTWFPRIMRFSLSTYANRLRDLCHPSDRRAGRHDMHNHVSREKRHFYPTTLDEQGLIDHSQCANCERKVKHE